MKCPICKQDSDFYNVDFEGYKHCPKCGIIIFDADKVTKNLKGRAVMKEVTNCVREDDFS